jgi:hypothetical protein
MLSISLAVFIIMMVAIFAFSWGGTDTSPGILTRVKIFMVHIQVGAAPAGWASLAAVHVGCHVLGHSHVGTWRLPARVPLLLSAHQLVLPASCLPPPLLCDQMISIFRDYDIYWPAQTDEAMGWFELANAGLAIMAPECYVGAGYDFYWYYVFQMVAPFVMVSIPAHGCRCQGGRPTHYCFRWPGSHSGQPLWLPGHSGRVLSSVLRGTWAGCADRHLRGHVFLLQACAEIHRPGRHAAHRTPWDAPLAGEPQPQVQGRIGTAI